MTTASQLLSLLKKLFPRWLVLCALGGTLLGHAVGSVLLYFLSLFVFDIPTAPKTGHDVLIVAVSNGMIFALQSVLCVVSLRTSVWVKSDKAGLGVMLLGFTVYWSLMYGANLAAEWVVQASFRPLWILRYLYFPIMAVGGANEILANLALRGKSSLRQSIGLQVLAGCVCLVLVLHFTGRGVDIIVLNIFCFAPVYAGLAAGLTIPLWFHVANSPPSVTPYCAGGEAGIRTQGRG